MARVKDAAIDLHNKYDSMGVHDLVEEIAKDATGEAVSLMSARIDFQTHYVELESALRKAVIREATLTIAVVKTQEYEDEITAPKGSPDRIVTMSQNVGLRGYVPDGEYYLIPREVKK